MVVLSQDVVLKRLRNISTAHDSIQTMALWIMHYKDKASVDVIVEGWLRAFQIAQNDQMRIALFYVMNDVVQKAKNKHMDVLIPAFQPAVLTAVGIGKKSEKVKSVMERCIQIFGERSVFTAASVTSMQVDDVPDSEEIALDIEMNDVVNKINGFVTARLLVGDIMKVMSQADFNFKSKVKHEMRDKKEGEHVLNTARDAIDTVIDVRHTMETHKKKMAELIETLELAKRVYSHQLKEVIVVEDAYKKFEMGVYEVHKELLTMEETKNYPGSTPPRDAPSPTANDDVYATGVESFLKKSEGMDHLDDMKMDVDEDDEVVEYVMPSTSRPSLYAQQVAANPMQKLSLQSRMVELGLANENPKKAKSTVEHMDTSSYRDSSVDFTKPPPSFASAQKTSQIDTDRDPRKKAPPADPVSSIGFSSITPVMPPPMSSGIVPPVQPQLMSPLTSPISVAPQNLFTSAQKTDIQSILRNMSSAQQNSQPAATDIDDRITQYHSSYGSSTTTPTTDPAIRRFGSPVPVNFPNDVYGTVAADSDERVHNNYQVYNTFQQLPRDETIRNNHSQYQQQNYQLNRHQPSDEHRQNRGYQDYHDVHANSRDDRQQDFYNNHGGGSRGYNRGGRGGGYRGNWSDRGGRRGSGNYNRDRRY